MSIFRILKFHSNVFFDDKRYQITESLSTSQEEGGRAESSYTRDRLVSQEILGTAYKRVCEVSITGVPSKNKNMGLFRASIG